MVMVRGGARIEYDKHFPDKNDGAVVFIDGRKRGRIPLKRPIRLRAGKHTVKVQKQGYTRYLDVFRVTAGRTTKLEIDLLPKAAVLIVGANVEKARV
ncbi:MAG: PEGA domain-containing protein, partial [Planctomycetes bacterium]|nr:PEGA domain-containing protein [Planctomycetota bacterium]